MINLNDMRIFAKVAELEGISAAARALNLPKSKVSRRMTILEEDLGARLMERTTRAVTLTEIGSLFYQHCQRVTEESENALHTLSEMRDKPRGLLRVSVSITAGQYLIAPHMAEFLELYPDIQMELDLSNRRVDLIGEGFDLVLRVGALPDSSLVSKKVGNVRAVMVASPEYLANQGTPGLPEDLQGHILLSMSNNSVSPNRDWVLENSKGDLANVPVEPGTAINDFTALRMLSEDGGGIAMMPEYVAHAGFEAGTLQRVLPEWSSPTISYYVLYPSRLGLTKKARAWIEFYERKMMGNGLE